MTFYHYNATTGLASTIKTLNKRKVIINTPPYDESFYLKEYGDHISLFIERPNLRTIVDDFAYDSFDELTYPHHRWRMGNFLFEYTVEQTSFNNVSFDFQVCESTQQTGHIYSELVKNPNLELNDPALGTQLANIIGDNSLYGNTLETMNTVIQQYIGTTHELFNILKFRPNFKKIRGMFCPTVPHLLVYPSTGELKVTGVKRVGLFGQELTMMRPYKLWDYSTSQFYRHNRLNDSYTLNIDAISFNQKEYIKNLLLSTDHYFLSDNYSRFLVEDLEELKTYRQHLRDTEFNPVDFSINLGIPPKLIAK